MGKPGQGDGRQLGPGGLFRRVPGAGHPGGGGFLCGAGRPDRRGVPGLYRLQLHAGVALPQPGAAAGGAEQDLHLRHPPVRHLRRPGGAELPPPGQAPYGRGHRLRPCELWLQPGHRRPARRELYHQSREHLWHFGGHGLGQIHPDGPAGPPVRAAPGKREDHHWRGGHSGDGPGLPAEKHRHCAARALPLLQDLSGEHCRRRLSGGPGICAPLCPAGGD